MPYGEQATGFWAHKNLQVFTDNSTVGGLGDKIDENTRWILSFQLEYTAQDGHVQTSSANVDLDRDVQNERVRGWIKHWCKQELEKHREASKNLRLIAETAVVDLKK